MVGNYITLIIVFILFCLFGGGILYYDYKNRQGKRTLAPDWISRDYQNVPGVGRCPRCDSGAHLTTTVDIPAIESEPGKLDFNKYDMKLYYSVRCNNCSLGTGNVEEQAQAMNDWNTGTVVKS